MAPPEQRHRGPLHHAVDLFVYAPIGFLAEAPSLLPRFVRRGRDQVAVVRAVGTYALRRDDAELDAVLDGHPEARSTLAALGIVPAADPATDGADGDEGDARSGRDDDRSTPAPLTAAAPAAGTPPAAPAPAEPYDETASAGLAIADYESLSATQVIPRLESLTPDELEAVRVYENENRARRTILSKIAQLQSG